MSKIIAICGFSGAGKDTIAKYISEHYGYEMVILQRPNKGGINITNLKNKIDDGGNRISYGEGHAMREPSTGKGRYDLITPFGMRRLAIWYELGSEKYADRNWEKGIPFSRYIDSAKRHLDKYLMGMEDEDHLAAATWNILAIMHHEELGELNLDDLPHYLRNKVDNEK